MPAEELLVARGVSKSYRTRDGVLRALDRVTLSVGVGEIVGIVGASGSGKSTLASIVCGLETADAGTLRFCGAECDATVRWGKRPQAYREAACRMQMVFQHPASSFSPRMTLGMGIEEGVAYLDVPRVERKQRVRDAFEAVGLPQSYAEKRVRELSGGECQRAAIARAVVGDPVLLVADEPTSALDVTTQAQIVRLLSDLCRERSMACLFISHDLALVQGLCARIYVMDASRIVEEGAPSDVFAAPRSEAARQLAASVIEL